MLQQCIIKFQELYNITLYIMLQNTDIYIHATLIILKAPIRKLYKKLNFEILGVSFMRLVNKDPIIF